MALEIHSEVPNKAIQRGYGMVGPLPRHRRQSQSLQKRRLSTILERCWACGASTCIHTKYTKTKWMLCKQCFANQYGVPPSHLTEQLQLSRQSKVWEFIKDDSKKTGRWQQGNPSRDSIARSNKNLQENDYTWEHLRTSEGSNLCEARSKTNCCKQYAHWALTTLRPEWGAYATIHVIILL